MSYMPRKSSSIAINDDDRTSATKSRPSRISRLAPPSNRAGGRSISAPRPSLATKSPATNADPSAASSSNQKHAPITTRQSRSVCATPLRTTPQRSSSAQPATAEKDRKAAAATLATQLVDKLHTHPQFRSEYLPNGLRSITTKHFCATLLFFMRSVVGNARGLKLPSAAEISTDDIGKWLTQIRYPHLQSRSWLKTPNVPHAFHHLVQLIGWLATFIPDDPNDPAPQFDRPENLLDLKQVYPSVAYIAVFLAELRTMFVSWNRDECIEAPKQRLIAEFAQHRMPHLPNAIEHLAAETAAIRREMEEEGGGGSDGDGNGDDQLQIDPALIADVERQTKRLRSLEATKSQLQEQCSKLKTARSAVSTELKLAQRQHVQLDTDLRRIGKAVRSQRLTGARRDELLHIVQQRRDAVAARHASCAHLRSAGHERHLAYTAAVRRQIAMATAVQQRVNSVGEQLQQQPLQTWLLDSRGGAEEFAAQLLELRKCFESLVQEATERQPELRSEAGRLTGRLSAVRADMRIKEAERAELEAGEAELRQRRAQLDEVLGMTRLECAQIRATMHTELDAMAVKSTETEERGRVLGQRLVELTAEAERMLADAERLAHRMMAEKERFVAEGKALLDELETEVAQAQIGLDEIAKKLSA